MTENAPAPAALTISALAKPQSHAIKHYNEAVLVPARTFMHVPAWTGAQRSSDELPGNTKPKQWPTCAAPATVSKCRFRVTNCLFEPLCDLHGKARQCHLPARIPARTGGCTGMCVVYMDANGCKQMQHAATAVTLIATLPVLLFNVTDGDVGRSLTRWRLAQPGKSYCIGSSAMQCHCSPIALQGRTCLFFSATCDTATAPSLACC